MVHFYIDFISLVELTSGLGLQLQVLCLDKNNILHIFQDMLSQKKNRMTSFLIFKSLEIS